MNSFMLIVENPVRGCIMERIFKVALQLFLILFCTKTGSMVDPLLRILHAIMKLMKDDDEFLEVAKFKEELS